MWILNWLPNFVFHLILITGVVALLASWVLKFIPTIARYHLPIQVGGVLLTVLGVWYEGGIAKDAEWKAKVAELEVKVAKAEAASSKQNVKVITRYVKRIASVKAHGDTIIKYIDRDIVKYDNTCPIPGEVVKALNAAALNQSIEEKK